MNYEPMTNQMVPDLDPVKISAKYDFVRVDISRDAFKPGGKDTYSQAAKALYTAFSGDNRSRILAIQYGNSKGQYSTTLYAMLEKCSDNSRLVYDARSQYDANSAVTVNLMKDVPVSTYGTDGPRILLQLLFNALGSVHSPDNPYAVMKGKLYWFDPQSLVFEDEDGYPDQVIAVEIFIDNMLRLHLDVCTFTDIRFANIDPASEEAKKGKKLVFTEKNPLASQQCFAISYTGGPHMKLWEEGDKGPQYIIRQFKGSKSSVPFFDVNGLDNFCKCKIGILHDVLDRFSLRYSELGSVGFATLGSLFAENTSVISTKDFYEDRLAELVRERPIRIIDKVGTEESRKIIASYIKGIDVLYNKKVEESTEPKKGCLNIILIHNAAYYEGVTDIHTISKDFAQQHITIEKSRLYKNYCERTKDIAPDNSEELIKHMGGLKTSIRVTLSELIIKQDIIEGGSISTYDWGELGFEDTISFVSRVTDDDGNEKYTMISIAPDGSIKSKYNLPECPEILEFCTINWESVEAVIVKGEGNDISINAIIDEDMYTLPEDINGIYEFLQTHPKSTARDENGNLIRGKKGIRAEENRYAMYKSLQDVQYVKLSEDTAYVFAGVHGSGMESVVHDSVRIRRIEAVQGSLFYDQLLPTMTVPFVRHGQLTVYPFPCKYVRELRRMDSGSKAHDEGSAENSTSPET